MSNWKTACKWIVIVSLLFLAVPIRVKNPNDDKNVKLFHSYMSQFNKTYNEGTREYNERFKIFKETLNHVDTLNHDRSVNHSARYGMTQFFDLSQDEFIDQFLNNMKKLSRLRENMKKLQRLSAKANTSEITDVNLLKNKIVSLGNIPLKFDWRDKGVISSVASQGLCGACWAYSAIQVTEAMAAQSSGSLTTYSVQEMIDCAANGNIGCKGGDICSLLAWIKGNNINIYTEDVYPSTGTSGECMYEKINSTLKSVRIKDFTCSTYVNREEDIIKTVATIGPVAVAINALTWQYYLGGVIQHHCPGDIFSLNHAVQIIGYDLTAEIPYYIAKNSWGKSFGLDGYLHIAIGGNVCGLANEVASVHIM